MSSTHTDRHLSAVPDTGDGQRPSPARTATEIKLWNALLAHAGSSTAELARHAGVGTSTAGKILPRWQQTGHVTRTPGEPQGKRRGPATWTASATNTDTATGDRDASGAGQQTGGRASGERRPAKGAKNTGPGRNTNGGSRLRSGELRGMVEDFLREPGRAGKDYTPGDIGRKLTRSSGAVSNCLEKLTDVGIAEQVSTKPRRFRLASAAAED